MGKILLQGLKFYAYHGHYEEEQEMGNEFEVDVVLETDLSTPAASDNLKDTIDYGIIYQLIEREMQCPSRLLENIAQRIIAVVQGEYAGIEQIEVKVTKFNPPIGGACRASAVILRYPR